ncbi:DsbC family protein [Cognatazoarcus halotolerans]|uniref:DsbC family protein n=1 Tax=Cognatazoarcus halotolerans TaxID=2686016 RepID=UPI001356BC92|nr:DsbC family protein [Cognatazoarcus halotolerans]MCP5308721.1 DsbC family protein [Zoogloeaceae bacterium]
MQLRFTRAVLPIMLAAAGLAHADEASVKKGVEAFLNAPAVASVTKTPYGGLYEVVLKSGDLIYTDEKVGFLVDGSIIDSKTRRNVTQARQNELLKIDFASLPLDQAIKQVKGNGKRVIATFEDPNCGFCKRLAKELESVDDITIYTFLYPVLGPDSLDKSKNIWCAKDKGGAWNDWMLSAKTPASASCDTSAIQKNTAFGQKHRVNGTPTIFLADGNRIGGFVPAKELERMMSQVGSK